MLPSSQYYKYDHRYQYPLLMPPKWLTPLDNEIIKIIIRRTSRPIYLDKISRRREIDRGTSPLKARIVCKCRQENSDDG